MSHLSQSARRFASATAIAAIGIAVALGTTGCGAGQISQTANQLPAVNGANENLGNLNLRNVQILYPTNKSDEVFADGGPFDVAFVIINSDQTTSYRLTSIKPKEQGSITLATDEGDTIAAGDAKLDIAPNALLRAGTPVGSEFASQLPEADKASLRESHILVTLDGAGKTVASGLTTDLVFAFQKKDSQGQWVDAGSILVDTPVDSGPELTRVDVPRGAEPPHDEHAGSEGHH